MHHEIKVCVRAEEMHAEKWNARSRKPADAALPFMCISWISAKPNSEQSGCPSEG